MFDTHFLVAKNIPFINIGLVVFSALIISLAEYSIYKYSVPRLSGAALNWRRILLKSLHAPLQTYVWIIAFSLVVEIVCDLMGFSGKLSAWIMPFRLIVTLLLLLWFVMRMIRNWELQFVNTVGSGRKKVFRDITSVNAVAQLLRVVTLIIVFLMILSSLGISISALLTFGGVGALALSFAAKDTLANFIGGLMIYWDRPFSVGDWVRSPDRDIEGTVSNIGWRLTKIQTLDKRPLYVPNAVFSTISLENPSRMSNRRINTLVGVRYEDAAKIESIVETIKKMIVQHNDLDITQSWFVNLVEFGESALNIRVYAFTKITDSVQFQSIQQDVLLKIIAIVMQHEAQLAYPTSTVYLTNDALQSGQGGKNG